MELHRGLVPNWDSDQIDQPYENFFDPLKLRENPELQQALAASADKRFRGFLDELQKPKNRNKRLSWIAKVMGISLAEWGQFLNSSYHTRAISIAAARLPGITNDMADDAMTQKDACGRCDGWGFVTVPSEDVPILEDGQPIPGGIRPMGARFVRDCPKCDGAGKVKRVGDAHARDKILQLNGFDKKGAGVTVAINNYGGMGIDAARNLSAITFDVNADGADGEIVEASPEAARNQEPGDEVFWP